jgi:tetratricopeptide (TPR) repeat protein/TolB-like protein
MPPSVGMRFSRYELLSRLGAGGMGEVWRAHDRDLHRDVAVKFLPERFAADEIRMSRFSQEARAASSLNHPNIVTIHEIGETSGMPFIVMELVEGRTLRDLVIAEPSRALPLRRVLEIGVQLADGLAKAHGAGIVHRDLKPENVMVTADGFVKILDFGLAKLRGGGSSDNERSFDSAVPTQPESPSPQTAVGVVLGTAGYMSPEQARGRPVDFPSDQFVLGAILYELATGRRAFHRETPAQTIAAIIEDPPESVGVLNPSLPAPLRWIIERCLAKDPAGRYASTLDLARELRNVRDRLSEVDSTGSSPWGRLAGPIPAAWARTARVGAVALVVLALAAGVREAWRRVGSKITTRPPVVAVLPVTNLTGQPEYDATAVGIAEIVVSSLAAIDGVNVLSRPATAPFRDRKADLAKVARELDATYLVDGSLQRSQQELRVSFSLVESPSNVVRWSETFDGAFPRLFELQSRVANGVAHALRVSLSPRARERIEARPTASPSAWESYTAALLLLDRVDRPGNAEHAVALLEAALQADPRFARAQAALGRALWARYEETGDSTWADRARDAVQEAIRLAPEEAEARLALSKIYEGRGKRTEALEEARRALELRPASDEILRHLAGLLVDDGQPEAALSAARRALALRPGFAENHHALGWVFFRTGRFHEAAQAFRRETELQPDNAWAFQRLGTALQLAGDLDGAAASYREAIRVAPAPRAWANLAAVYYAQGKTADAVRSYQEAARLEPQSGTIRRSLGDARAKAGDSAGAEADWRAAIDLSQSALEVNPRDTRQLKNVAICFAKLGERAEALRAAEQALEAGPAVADTRYGVAMVHALLGDTREALALLGEALDLGASPDLAERDDEFAPLRALPEFRQLIDKAKVSHEEVNHAS